MTRTTKTVEKSKNSKAGKNKITKKSTTKKDKSLHGERKQRKIINWKEYNESLVKRGTGLTHEMILILQSRRATSSNTQNSTPLDGVSMRCSPSPGLASLS